MFLRDGTVVTSASDLTAASHCEFEFLRALDAKLGRLPAVEQTRDPMLDRAATLGDAHEARVLERYRFELRVVEIERPDVRRAGELEAALAATQAAFRSDADVVFQAAFSDADFVGFADFIVRQPDGRWLVQDTKLARSAKVTALLQLAAYVEQLRRIGVPTADTVQLLLGNGTESTHRLRDIEPVYRNRRERLRRIVAERLDDDGPVAWGDPRYTACGRCDTCTPEVESHRDPLLVAGLRLTQRDRLLAAGVRTIDELAASSEPVHGISETALEALRQQARLQLQPVLDGALPAVEVYAPGTLSTLPQPSEGDIFFDFEGDPLYSEGEHREWGLDYLFGLTEVDGTYRAFWAHDYAEERVALAAFLDYVQQRRREHPDLHIYHYASYERVHLLSLAARHGIGEDVLDELLRDNVLVDLYPMVKRSVRVGVRSYSIKKLEPLYMGSELREADVQSGADSITAYIEARRLLDNGAAGDPEATGAGRAILDDLADYNRYDCVSTHRLRDWLLARAAKHGVVPGAAPAGERQLRRDEASPLFELLMKLAGDPLSERTADQQALALAAAAIDYHRRESKTFWWDHFARLVNPVDEWADTRDVFVADERRVLEDWHIPEGKQAPRRVVRMTGRWAPGSRPRVQDRGPFALYEYPGPFTVPRRQPGSRPDKEVGVTAVGEDWVEIEEYCLREADPWDALPIALTPAAPPPGRAQVGAIAQWGQAVLDAHPAWPQDAMVDLLRRTPPRSRTGALARDADPVEAVVRTLLDLDSSYLAVQGPPGTGKTHLAAHVIARLVRDHGWRIGVVAQSHAVVENVLDRVVAVGLDRTLVAKKPQAQGEVSFTALRGDGHAAYIAQHRDTGFVIGGTAWDFANVTRFERKSLDLLVIDEAGQFSLASTIAAAVSARNVLLLGDPQQLPQVSQGTHPEPVDASALGFISDGHDVLPPELGFFLAETRRMDRALTASVSDLSYEGALRSHPTTRGRRLDGVVPGLHLAPVLHDGNATSSEEEAAEVVRIVRDALGRGWTDPTCDRSGDALREDDIIVVSPYNAQVALVERLLAEAGLPRVRVGTVDRFQGQEAVIAVVSLAASSPAEVPRGLSFLLMRNRLNVAISRAQWAAYLVHSPELTEHLPRTVDGVAELSAFLRLLDAGRQTEEREIQSLMSPDAPSSPSESPSAASMSA